MAYQMAYKKCEKQETKVRKLHVLILDSVTLSIQSELENISYLDNPIKAANYLKKTYDVFDERARQQLLEEVNKLTLAKCASMTEYINKHREFEFDLARAQMSTYADGTMITNILAGLPKEYQNVKERWDWVRAQDSDKKPDFQSLRNSLLIKEEDLAKRDKSSSDRIFI